MTEISLTDFVDFVLLTGRPKLTKVREVKERGPYERAFDFWGPLREAIVRFHRSGSVDVSELTKIAAAQSDRKKTNRYPDAVKGYRKFLKSRTPEWFKPPSGIWTQGTLQVRINPEIGLKLPESTVIKLYFKEGKPTKDRIATVLQMMRSSLPDKADTRFAVLDVNRAKLHVLAEGAEDIEILLKSEALAFETMWNGL